LALKNIPEKMHQKTLHKGAAEENRNEGTEFHQRKT